MRTQVTIVLGMHRSGTSVIARGLAACGVSLGSNLLGADVSNPSGHWEDLGMFEINEKILKFHHVGWHDLFRFSAQFLSSPQAAQLLDEACRYVLNTFSRETHWSFKDPRTLRTLPFWIQVFERCEMDVSYLLAIRNPRSVVASLKKRNQRLFAEKFLDEQAYLLWLSHIVPNLKGIMGRPGVVVDYDEFMAAPESFLRGICESLKMKPEPDDERAINEFTRGFVDEKLRHSRFDVSLTEATAYGERLAVETYSLIKANIDPKNLMFREGFLANWDQATRVANEFLKGKESEERLLKEIRLLRGETETGSSRSSRIKALKRWLKSWRGAEVAKNGA